MLKSSAYRSRRVAAFCAAASLCALASARGRAQAAPTRPIVGFEARVSLGVAAGGGSGIYSIRRAPITFGALGEAALITQPWTSVYGELFAESEDRASFGGGAGFRVRPTSGRFRLTAGGRAIFTPYTLYGAVAGGGVCFAPFSVSKFCADLELTAYFAGSDLPDSSVAEQLMLVIGVGFDAL